MDILNYVKSSSPERIQNCSTGEYSNETFELSHCFGYLSILLKFFFSFYVIRQLFVFVNFSDDFLKNFLLGGDL